jgi:Protein of unknown function (DUF3551)
MRATGLVLISLATLLLTIADAAAGDWCASYGGKKGGSESCGYPTLQQCQANLSGIGGFCRPNPFPGTAFGTGGTWPTAPRH